MMNMTDGSMVQSSQVIVGASTYMLDYVRKIMNDFFEEAELSDDTISLFVTEMQSLYELQTGNIGIDWETQTQALLGCIARWAALYAATALNSAASAKQRNTARHVKFRYRIPRTVAYRTAKAAASVGVAIPLRMEPSTVTINTSGGRIERIRPWV